jgi:DNA invertase Pin-like site-specific DNA recombinase
VLIMPTAAIYLRISQDRAKRAAGITRQREDTKQLAARLGATTIREYADNDRSASNGKPRENYERLLADLRTGALASGDMLLAYNQDRLVRDLVELEELLAAVRAAGVTLHVTTGVINASTADGRTAARLVGVIARGEVEKVSERVRRAMVSNAEQGRAHGAVRYGWDRVYGPKRSIIDEPINEAQAAIVHEIVSRLLAGDSLHGIAEDLNRRTVRSPRGATWKPTTVKWLAIRPANASLRVHNGHTYPAAWPPIIAPDQHAAVTAIVTDPRRRTSPAGGGRARTLLSGIAIWGPDGTAMYAAESQHVYRARRGGQRLRSDLDAYVSEVVAAWLDSDEAKTLLAELSTDAGRAALIDAERVREQMDAAAKAYAAGALTIDQLTTITSELRPALEDAQQRAQRHAQPAVWADLVGDGAAFDRLPLDRKRAIIRARFTITVWPKRNFGSKRWESETIEITGADSPKRASAKIVQLRPRRGHTA